MGLFSSLFPKRGTVAPNDINIDFHNRKIVLNGKAIDIMCHMSVIEDILGKPRVNKTRSGNSVMTYDKYGIMFYTKGNNVMFCIEIRTDPDEQRRKLDPKKCFCGTITIEGQQWEEFMYNGENVGFGRRRVCDGISYIAEYSDGKFGDMIGFHGAYYSISVELATLEND